MNQLMMLFYSMLETFTITDSDIFLEILFGLSEILFGLFYLVTGGVILLVVNVVRMVLILLGWGPVPVPWV